jgi:hypothetical protein
MEGHSRAIFSWEDPVSTLYKRANPIQVRMLRIVEGAVHNTLHAHKDKEVSNERFARSVAKRAVGTLYSQMDIIWHKTDKSVKVEMLAGNLPTLSDR